MPELQLTPTEPAPTQTSLLGRLFRPKDIGFYLMIVLAWIGSIYTTYDLASSRWYWHWLIPIFGLICIVTQWNNVEPTLKSRLLLLCVRFCTGARYSRWRFCSTPCPPAITTSSI